MAELTRAGQRAISEYALEMLKAGRLEMNIPQHVAEGDYVQLHLPEIGDQLVRVVSVRRDDDADPFVPYTITIEAIEA